VSTKIYGGRIAQNVSVEEWQERLRAASLKYRPIAKRDAMVSVFDAAVAIRDGIEFGLSERGEKTPLTKARDHYEEMCQEVKKGLRVPFFDTSFGVSWHWMGGHVYAVVFAEHEISKSIEKDLGLEDYHYQDQTDRDEGITNRDWNERKKVWKKILGGDSPEATMSHFQVVPEPRTLCWWPELLPEEIKNPSFDSQGFADRSRLVAHELILKREFGHLPPEKILTAYSEKDFREGGKFYDQFCDEVERVASVLMQIPTMDYVLDKVPREGDS
jgi:hypothetical protein